MSNKTIYKRIALVAVTALGAGVLSVAPASAASNAAVGGTNATTAAGVLNIATEASITGDAVLSASGSGVDSKSLGLLANSTTQTTSSLTSTATMRADGEIVFYYTGTAAKAAATVVVDGGTISDSALGGASSPAKDLNAAKTQIVMTGTTAALTMAVAVTPNAGATSMTVSLYESAVLTTGNAAEAASIQSGVTSKGTMLQRYVVTIATTSASGVYNAGESYVQAQISTGIAAPTTNVDATGSTTIANSATAVGFVSFDLRDAYAVSLAGKGALVVSATNGAGVALKNTTDGTYGAASSVTLLTAVSNFASGTVTVARPTAYANKGFSTTVTISWNGAVVGTKSFTFQGEVASLVVTPRRIGATKQTLSNTDAFRVTYADSAGNTLYPLTAGALGSTVVVAATTTSVVTGASIGTEATATDAAKGTLLCAAGASDYLLAGGTAQLQLQHVNPVSGTTVKSNVWTATCQGSAYTYTAAFDKPVYTPGSVATLTITFKDRDGDLANGYDVVGTTADLITITGGPSATAVTIPANGDTATSGTGLAGIKTYQFIVGSTEGDYQSVVSVPIVNGRNSSQANQTVAYSVKDAVGSVSNADVLKSIVALIASINKQIQALQALILKKK
jgi:hypothetical protein